MNTQTLIKFHPFAQKKLSGNEILTIAKSPNNVVNLQILIRNNPNVDLVNLNAYEISGVSPSVRSLDIKGNEILEIKSRVITLLEICENWRVTLPI